MHSCMCECACENFEFYFTHWNEKVMSQKFSDNIHGSAKKKLLNQTSIIKKTTLNTNPIRVEDCVAVWWSCSTTAIKCVIIITLYKQWWWQCNVHPTFIHNRFYVKQYTTGKMEWIWKENHNNTRTHTHTQTRISNLRILLLLLFDFNQYYYL